MLEQIKHEVLRLRGELMLFIVTMLIFWIVGISRGNLEVMVYKFALLSVATIVVHLGRQLVFNYICLEDCIQGENAFKKVPVPIRVAVIAGVLFMYPVIIYSIMVAA